MKTLYLSDLDGTLLNSNQRVSDYTAKTVNELIDDGIFFFVCNGTFIKYSA